MAFDSKTEPKTEIKAPAPAPKPALSDNEVIARRVTFAETGVVYVNECGVRKYAKAGDDLSDMTKADVDEFKKTGILKTRLVEVEA